MNKDQLAERSIDEWNDVIARTSIENRTLVHAIVESRLEDIRQWYLRYIESDGELAHMMGSADNAEEFARRFVLWLRELVDARAGNGESFFREQHGLGDVLARIGFPVHALSRSIRKLKLWFLARLEEQPLNRQQLVEAVAYVVALLDIALEVREVSYHNGVASTARVHEAYRLYLLGQNLGMERERQRAALMEWSHGVLAALYQSETPTALPRLSKAEFGLWLHHKAQFVFERDPKVEWIAQAVDRIDRELVPALEQAAFGDRTTLSLATRRLEEELSAIKFTLNSMFEAHIEVENGRDPLTQLHTRRFLPSVMIREVQLQKMPEAVGFCVLMVDVDRFKSINDTYGHQTGDTALKEVAAVISQQVRQIDFVFRYGGEELLVVLVDCKPEQAMQSAESIRRAIAGITVQSTDGRLVPLTASIGVAAYKGELDYERLLERADKALYMAKEQGRNRVVAD